MGSHLCIHSGSVSYSGYNSNGIFFKGDSRKGENSYCQLGLTVLPQIVFAVSSSPKLRVILPDIAGPSTEPGTVYQTDNKQWTRMQLMVAAGSDHRWSCWGGSKTAHSNNMKARLDITGSQNRQCQAPQDQVQPSQRQCLKVGSVGISSQRWWDKAAVLEPETPVLQLFKRLKVLTTSTLCSC